MTHYKFDVIIIGAGPAGVTAAGALGHSGAAVALLEAGVYAGAENWSGCVYFAESLAAPDCFGPDAVAAAPFERRVARRGTLMHNGLDVIGLELNDAAAFRNCYTVLRPVYDPYFANLARAAGVVHLTGTTVTALIRSKGRVIGVETNRGPLLADVTFIAEGDASHLVTAEQLERVHRPHFLQGVKAVLSLPADEIEKRFRLAPREGAAYELLLRNPAIAGRSAKLNIGGFLYTNRDSISIGYVAPLDNIRDNFRGSHDAIYEWMAGLPFIRELIQGSTLSAYGTKIIRSGGWQERPILVQDGLAVGGASAGMGIDIPFPNFTGPASATGLYFGRAVVKILEQGASFDAKCLDREYAAPLLESSYGRNAAHLSRWPGYFGKSKVLFSRTVDLACGAAHFLSERDTVNTGRFLRSHILSFRALRELALDNLRAVNSLGLGKRLAATLVNPATLGRWVLNLFGTTRAGNQQLDIVLHINGGRVGAESFPWPINSLIRRLSPALLLCLQQIYANDDRPLEEKFQNAARAFIRGFSLPDLVILPLYGSALFMISLGTAVADAFRFYVLRTPVEKLLAEPVMAYAEAQKTARDLDRLKPTMSLEAKLATNTYRVGTESHIRTLWPEAITNHPDMAKAGIWWVCPARVYLHETPAFTGRGRVSINYENCIKCESCWRAEPERAVWGRHTEHRLIYRPRTAALAVLLESLGKQGAAERPLISVTEAGEKPWQVKQEILRAARDAVQASRAFRDSVKKIPPSADKARASWPLSLGKRFITMLTKIETALLNEGRQEQAHAIGDERKAFELKLADMRFIHAFYSSGRIEERLHAWMPDLALHMAPKQGPSFTERDKAFFQKEAAGLFPDRIVKEWEESPMPDAWCDKLRTYITDRLDTPVDVVRALSSVSPALGLIAACQTRAAALLKQAGFTPDPGVCAVTGDHLVIQEKNDGIRIAGTLTLVPVAAMRTLLVLSGKNGYLVPLTAPGVSVRRTPAVGFRAADYSEITLDCIIKSQAKLPADDSGSVDSFSYLAIALGVADYLARRVKDHAAARVQFPGQMLDTEGRDGIAKLGAVKALISRIEAWRILLQHLYSLALHAALPAPHSALPFDLLISALAARAFGPEPGTLGYDAGQVFGGFAYSEDDLLSRTYRDSSFFRFLAPGYGAAAMLNRELTSDRFEQALGAVGDLDRVQREPLGAFLSSLAFVTNAAHGLATDAEEALAGETKALIIGTRSLLVSLEQDLKRGESSEAGAAAVNVLLGMTRDAVMSAALSSRRGSVPASAVFPVEPAGLQAAGSDYEAFCTGPGKPHQSGDFLAQAFDRSPRFVPEMQLSDVRLRTRWAELVEWFRTNCQEKSFEGLNIERFIDKEHRLPAEIIAAAKKNKWLATYIPQSLDGLGWRKAEYYILNSAAGSFGDASIDLLIMASTSIGTTPILLGLEEELPRVREELAPLVRDEQTLGEIGSRLAQLIKTLSNPDPASIKKAYEGLMKLVDERLRHTRVAKYLAANFLKAFYGAGLAGRRGDFGAFISGLKQAGGLFGKLMPDVRAALEELPRRERCHKLFLRSLGNGAVSAFALTEPTAGSDSGGVKTNAKLLSAPLTRLDDGRYSFNTGADEQGVRYLIDADKIIFVDNAPAYETQDGHPHPILYDKYDYRTDLGYRYYIHQGRECPFHDIGQVRASDSGLRYEYYSLTGAKMWITNGSIATQFCLYAQTPEGVTGFLVDRHSEGLKVGADEKKTGQRGSPTNEISIDNVRVPREAVIGYEGHGQVNALETLNVGRCGLAVVSGALMRKLMNEANALVPASPERDRLLGEAAAVLFGSESLAYYLVGLFDRAHESVRLESAIAKYACSEDIHELITLVEQAFGPEGQTEKYLIEKARRDSRILTIYEGTNEVQRFLILKDLIALAADWPEHSAQQAQEPDKTLAFWKNRLRKHVKEVARVLGDTGWSDAMLQPALFPLSEMAGEILRLECIEHRKEWLTVQGRRIDRDSPGYGAGMLAAGQRATARTLAKLEHFDAKFLQAWDIVGINLQTPEVVLADAAYDAPTQTFDEPATRSPVLQVPLRMLSIIRPVADLSPNPGVMDGDLRELVWKIDPADLAAMEQALRIKANSRGRVTVDVLLPGRIEQEMLLKMTVGSRADVLYRLETSPSVSSPGCIPVLKDLVNDRHYDIITTGSGCLNGDRSFGAYLAGRFKRHYARRNTMDVKPDGSGLENLALPAVVSITGSVPSPVLDMNQAVVANSLPVTLLKIEEQGGDADRFVLPVRERTVSPVCTDPVQAAAFINDFAASAGAGEIEDFTGKLSEGKLQAAPGTWAVLEPGDEKVNLALLRASALSADLMAMTAVAVIPAPKESWPRLLGLARANGCGQAYCLDTKGGSLSNDGKRELLGRIIKTSDRMTVMAGPEWIDALAYAAGEVEEQKRKTCLCSEVTDIRTAESGAVLFTFPAYEGKLLKQARFADGSAFLAISREADFPAQVPKDSFKASLLDPAVSPGWIMPLPPAAPPTLSQADVIIDLGYGIRDRAGFELAGKLKKKMESLGLAPLFGATRKVTQDLKLLPLEAQIGQTGVRVNPRLIIALGISGAPQHVDYLGTRTEILCFNKDTEAPLMKLNQTRTAPRVHPVPGDLFVTVRQLIEELK